MPNLINPVSSRLGSSRLWESTWTVSNQYLYAYNSILEQQRYIYVNKLFDFISDILGKESTLSLLNFKTISVNKTFYLLFYIKLYDLVKNKKKLYKFLCSNVLLEKLKINKNKILLRTPKRKIFLTNVEKKEDIRPDFFKVILKEYRLLPKFYTTLTLSNFNDIFLATALNTKKAIRKLHSAKLIKFTPSVITIELLKLLISKRFFFTIKLFFSSVLRKMYFSQDLPNLKLFFVIIPSYVFSSFFLTQYIINRLKARYPVRRLVKTLVMQTKRIQDEAQVLGLKVTCSGRFERRGRASYVWETTGMVGNSNSLVDVDYNMSLVTLTNSICAVRVWVVRNAQSDKVIII